MVKTIELLDQTVEHCDFVTTCHYIQAEASKKRRIWVGVPALGLNIVIGSILVFNLGTVIPDYVKWITAIISLIVSLLVAVQTFFRFDEEERNHRQLGNDFSRISRHLARVKASWLDKTIPDKQLALDFESAMKEYETVCAQNEKCPPSRSVAEKIKKTLRAKLTESSSCIASKEEPNSRVSL